jgi:hypothetical protein
VSVNEKPTPLFTRVLLAVHIGMRKGLAVLVGQREMPEPSMSEAQAIEIANRYSAAQGWGAIDHPYGRWFAGIGNGRERWDIYSYDPSGLGAATRIGVDCETGEIIDGGHIAR